MKRYYPQKLTERDIQDRNALLHCAKMIMALAAAGIFALAWYEYYGQRIFSPFSHRGNWLMFGLCLALYILFAKLYGAFQVGNSRISELIYSQSIALFFTYGIMYCVVCLLSYRAANPLPLLGALFVSGAISYVWVFLTNYLHNFLFPPKRTYIVYDYLEAYRSIADIGQLTWKFRIEGAVSISRGLEGVLEAISDAEAVFICGVSSSERNALLKYCIEHNIQAYLRPKIGDLIVSSAKRIHLLNLPVLYCTRNRASLWYISIKRTMDVAVSLCALIIASPFMVATALVIKLYDRGPVFYRQCRLTKDGKKFEILKFRSMRIDAEQDGIARLASENDDRITPVGKIIRAIRFDELPQIFNVLKGDMSLVGDRRIIGTIKKTAQLCGFCVA